MLNHTDIISKISKTQQKQYNLLSLLTGKYASSDAVDGVEFDWTGGPLVIDNFLSSNVSSEGNSTELTGVKVAERWNNFLVSIMEI